MACRKQVYKLTYPNGKIYVGMELTRWTSAAPRSTWRGTHSAKLSVVFGDQLPQCGLVDLADRVLGEGIQNRDLHGQFVFGQ